MATRQQVEEALTALYTTEDAGIRAQADQWLRGFQDSPASWQVAVSLLSESKSGDHKLFAATLLCNKLRGGGRGGLSANDGAALRTHLVQFIPTATWPTRLRPQLCRAVASLVDHPSELLADAQFGALPLAMMLDVLARVPDCSCWLLPADVEAMHRLLLLLLDHAYAPGQAPFPSHMLPAKSEPPLSDSAHRVAVLECTCAWLSCPAASDEGLTLGLLAEAACMGGLLRALGCAFSDGAIGAGPQGSEAAEQEAKEQRLVAELLNKTLDDEPTADVQIGPAQDGRSSKKNALQVLPHVPPSIVFGLMPTIAAAIAPLALTASRPKDADDDDDEEDDDDDEGVAAARRALAVLGGTLLRKAPASLLGLFSADSSGVDANNAAAGSAAATALLAQLIPCSTHRSRVVCELVLATDVWPPALRAIAHWRDRGAAGQVCTELLARLLSRAAFPSDDAIGSWGANELEDYLEFRENYLAEPIADLARQDPLAVYRAALAPFANASQVAAGVWQRREAALFTANAAAHVLLSRVLAPPPPPGQSDPDPHRAELAEVIPHILRASAMPPASCTASAAGEALLLLSRCRLVASLAPWLAAHSAESCANDALDGIVMCLAHAAPATAEAAVLSVSQLSNRCASQLGASPARLDALLTFLASPHASISAAFRRGYVQSCARIVVSVAREQNDTAVLSRLFLPLLSSIDATLRALESAGTSDASAIAAAAAAPAASTHSSRHSPCNTPRTLPRTRPSSPR